MNADQIYLSEFGEVLLFVAGGFIFIVLTLFLSRLIRPDRPNKEKLSSYESGEEPVSAAWTQFSVRFYVIALIFLLFEVEIIFLFPWATVFADKELLEKTSGQWGWLSVFEAVMFILILALGLIYAWANGHLNWIKPDPKPTPFKSAVPREFYSKINDDYAGTTSKKNKT